MLLSQASKDKLKGVNANLVRVVERAIQITQVDFRVLEGLRSVERQKKLVAAGASRTMNSKHITGHAVDLGALVDGEINWSWPLYYKIAEAMKQASEELKIPVVWGGTWKLLSSTAKPITAKVLSRTFPDGGHFEIKP